MKNVKKIEFFVLAVVLVGIIFSFRFFLSENIIKEVQAVSALNFWGFEEASGSIVLDSVGGVNGTLVNGVTRTTVGRNGKALKFDGVNDYVNLTDTASLESQNFSISVWIKRTGAQMDWAKILTKGVTNATPWASYKLEFNGANDTIINWHIGFTDNSAFLVRNTTPIPDEVWTHMVGTWDGNDMKLYMNGVLQGTKTVGAKTVKFDTIPLTLGGYAGWGYFKGELDQVKYLDHALSNSEVLELFTEVPSVTVISPNSILDWGIGSIHPIIWNHNMVSSSTSNIKVSRDGGITWTQIVASALNGNQTGTYNWNVTGNATSQALIKVTPNIAQINDISDVNFSINNPVINVIYPNTSSDNWVVGDQKTITWTDNLGSSENVKIELSKDGGISYPIIISASTPADGSEIINVLSGWDTTTARVRITWLKNTAKFGVSSSNFTITDAVLTLTPVNFQPSSAVLMNPDRGFFTWTDLNYSDFSYVRQTGNTLTRPYFRLDDYRNLPLPQSFLDLLTQGFQKARDQSIKIIPRFSYNFRAGDPDATQQRIQEHIQQLAPVLTANADVISSVEASFVGAWGEWHTSTNQSDSPTSEAAIVNSLMNAFPSDRMIAIRYPSDLKRLQVTGPISAGEAYSGTTRARLGSHQDCFLASDPDDWGTWGKAYDYVTQTWPISGSTPQEDKNYIAQNGRYSVVGGETCNPNPRANCSTALAELSLMHFSYLNEEYHPLVIQKFINDGCFTEIENRLGYRYEFLNGSYTGSVARGSDFKLNLGIINQGWASMFNARPVFAVLDNGTDKYTFPINSDPRLWTPGTTINLTETFSLSANMTPGIYTLALWMPDQYLSIRDNPLYAVQFANNGIWNSSKGYNVIANNITITQ